MCHSCDSGNGIELNGESDHGDESDNGDWINNGNDESNKFNNGNDQYYKTTSLGFLLITSLEHH